MGRESDERGCLLICSRQEVAEGKSVVIVAFLLGIPLGCWGVVIKKLKAKY